MRFYRDVLGFEVKKRSPADGHHLSAWEVGSSNHGVSLSLYAKDPDGLECEIFWLDLEGELARRGIAMHRGT